MAEKGDEGKRRKDLTSGEGFYDSAARKGSKLVSSADNAALGSAGYTLTIREVGRRGTAN